MNNSQNLSFSLSSRYRFRTDYLVPQTGRSTVGTSEFGFGDSSRVVSRQDKFFGIPVGKTLTQLSRIAKGESYVFIFVFQAFSLLPQRMFTFKINIWNLSTELVDAEK